MKVKVPDSLPPLLTIKQFADLLQVRRQTVRAWVAQGRIQVIRIKPGGTGRCVRIPRSELELLLNAGFAGVDNDAPPAPEPVAAPEFSDEPDEYEF